MRLLTVDAEIAMRPRMFLLFMSALFLPSCTTVPQIDGVAKVSVKSVAERVKCEIWNAAGTVLRERPGQFAFLSHWGAKAHLTLAVDDMATVNPGASIINPLPNSQSFSQGLGVGLTTEAIATTDIEFFLSFAEMSEELKKDPTLALYQRCRLQHGNFLDGDLRLNALFESALEPVAAGVLTTGKHPGVAGASAPPITPAEKKIIDSTRAALRISAQNRITPSKTKAPTPEERTQLSEKLKKMDPQERSQLFTTSQTFTGKFPGIEELTNTLHEEEVGIPEKRVEAEKLSARVKTINGDVIKPLSDVIIASFPACAESINQLKSKSIVASAITVADKIKLDSTNNAVQAKKLIEHARSVSANLDNDLREVVAALDSCPHKPAPDTSLEYDPIDLMSQTINFYVTSSANVTPTWKLVRVSAPLAPSFFTASRKDTNTLILAFGRADVSKQPADQGPVANQILVSNLRDALNVRQINP